MAYTDNRNLAELPLGVVDWIAIINDAFSKIDTGGTIRATAGEVITKAKGVTIDTDERAIISLDSEDIVGLWQNTSTLEDVEGFIQIDGTMEDVGWAWTPGGFLIATHQET